MPVLAGGYFWVLVLTNVASVFLDPPELEDWVLLLLTAVALAGQWGYLRNRALGHRLFWVAVLGTSVLAVTYCVARLYLLDPAWRGLVAGGAVIALSLGAPLLLALWRYAFRSPTLWSRRTPPDNRHDRAGEPS